MSQEHVWSCGKCGARVVAKVGGISTAFKAHTLSCPAIVIQPNQPAAGAARPAAIDVGATTKPIHEGER